MKPIIKFVRQYRFFSYQYPLMKILSVILSHLSLEVGLSFSGPFNQDLLEKLFQASDTIALDLGALNVT